MEQELEQEREQKLEREQELERERERELERELEREREQELEQERELELEQELERELMTKDKHAKKARELCMAAMINHESKWPCSSCERIAHALRQAAKEKP